MYVDNSTVRISRIGGRALATAADEDRLKPLILVIGFMRSGKTTLAHALGELPGMCVWEEPNAFWSTGHATRPSDVADASDAKPWVVRHMHKVALQYQREHGNGRIILEGTFAALKIPFLRAVFPDLKVIHLYRDGREVVRERLVVRVHHRALPVLAWQRFTQRLSQMNWRDGLSIPQRYARAVSRRMWGRREKHWFGLRYPGWQHDRKRLSPAQIAAREWITEVTSVQAEIDKLGPSGGISIRSESLYADPATQLRQIAVFCGLEPTPELLQQLEQSFRAQPCHPITGAPGVDDFDSAVELMRPVLQKLGYL